MTQSGSPTNEVAKSDDDRILDAYGVPDPSFAFILGGFRRISVNPKDARARKMLLKKGLKYFSRVQSFIFSSMNELPVDLFLDVGSNYGECAFSVPLYSSTRVVGFEANQALHEHLQRSRAYNDDVSNIEFVHAAVSSKAGEVLTFYIDNAWSGKSSVVHDKKKKNQTKVEVRATSVDQELKRIGGSPNLLLLKVDVEGYEPAVFEGARHTIASVPNIVCLMEFDSKYLAIGGTDPAAFFSRLSADFEIFQLEDSMRQVTSYAELGDEEGGVIHTNLVLSRCRHDSVATRFRERIVQQNLKQAAGKAWR